MVALQVLSKILASGSNSIVEDNLLTEEYFVGYEAEFNFIQDHVRDYGNVPDKATFFSHFPDIELVEVTESDNYLIDTIREEYQYYKAVPIVKKVAELLKEDSNRAAEYLISATKELQPHYRFGGVDIIADAQKRFDEYIDIRDNKDKWIYTTGFPELDDLLNGGIKRKEELVVIVARTNQGKSWMLEKICEHIWQLGNNVGYISQEMGDSSLGYRFDTLHRHFSNSGLQYGKDDIDEAEYRAYIEELRQNKNAFIVAQPADFDNRVTVTKLRKWVQQKHLGLLAIDGIKYLTDERYRRGDSTTTSLTNISQDLMALSLELSVPVLIVQQANREGVVEKGSEKTPELEHIRDSDGIAHNASKVFSMHQKDNGVLVMRIPKNRGGAVGGKLTWNWSINTGEFSFIPTYDDAERPEVTARKVDEVRKQYKDKTDVF